MPQTFTYNFGADGNFAVTAADTATNDSGLGLGYDIFSITGIFEGQTIGGLVGTGGAFSSDSGNLGQVYDNVVFTGNSQGAGGSSYGIDGAGIEFTTFDGPHYNVQYGSGPGPLGGFQYVSSPGDGFLTLQSSDAPCYASGSLILTERGEVAVENLAIRDLLMTKDGVARPIKWIGRRSYAGRFLLANPDVLPIVFKAGSLGDNCPRRDLRVSPHHAMYVDGVLIPAASLVDDVCVIRETSIDRVDYFHIELDSHDVIIAEGALSETFLDDGSRGMFHNAAEYDTLYSEEPDVFARFCAPRFEDGPQVDAARDKIAARSGRFRDRPDAGPLSGHFEVSAERVFGWARNDAYPGVPVCLDIFADGLFVGHALANKRGADIGAADLDRQAFAFRLPSRLDGQRARIEVRRSLDAAPLNARGLAA
jgi:hypothetical protein